MNTYYHVCFTVPDLGAAMRDLSRVASLTWREPRARRIGDWDYRIVFSEGPPYVELIEAAPGGPWGDTSKPGFHHFGFWSPDQEAESSRLEDEGFGVEFSGCPYGRPFAYHRVDSIGANVELIDVSARPGFLETWGFPAS
ncbi:VOC family protein [Actinomadura harenae]|uniref:VOC family protein n=1 Tax=Actinomadura harenae TaxID=2483351 RepID=A0A3M2LKZ2_9ACTN|nr:VOC family protein [Actinomadura harenae]RMI38112.1 VOC family protein [Actinomadura harenae]